MSSPTIHGDIATTLIDIADGIALRAMLDDLLAGGAATINLSVNYLRQTSGDPTAIAEVVRAGSPVGANTTTIVGTGPEEDSDVAVRQSPPSDWDDIVVTG